MPMDRKIIYLVLFALLLNLSYAQAWEWDNVKSYDVEKKEITITNALGLGDVLMNIKMIENTYHCSGDCYTIFSIKNYNEIPISSEFSSTFKWEFLDLKKDSNRENMEYEFYFADKTKEIEKYEGIGECKQKLDKNGSYYTSCEQLYKDISVPDFELWDYKNKVLPVGEFYLKVSGQKSMRDEIDNIPTFIGKRLTEFAKWGDVKAYANFTFDNNADLGDDTGKNQTFGDAVNNWVSATTPCISEKCVNISSKSGNVTYYTPAIYGGFSFWFRPEIEIAGPQKDIISYNVAGSNNGDFGIYYSNENAFCLYKEGTEPGEACWEAENFIANRWAHIYAKYNTTGMYLYVNGVRVASKSAGESWLYGNTAQTSVFLGTGNGGFASKALIDEVKLFDVELSNNNIIDLYLTENGTLKIAPNVTLTKPTNDFITALTTIEFNCSARDDIEVKNITLYIDGYEKYTQAGNGSASLVLYQNITNLTSSSHNWTCYAIDNENAINNTQGTRNFSVDILLPSAIFTFPENASYMGVVDAINYTYNESNPDKCWYSLNMGVTNSSRVACGTNFTGLTPVEGSNTWMLFINDTASLQNKTKITFFYAIYNYTQASDKNLIGEGTTVTFNLSVQKVNIPSTTAILIYNNTEYSPTTTIASDNDYYFEKSITIPKGDGNSTTRLIKWDWKYTISGVTVNDYTTNNTLKVTAVTLDNCTGNTARLLNVTLKDENSNTDLDITGKTSIIKIDLSLKSINNLINWDYNITYTNITNFSICIPAGAINNSENEYLLDVIADFKTDEYVEEFYYIDNDSITYSKLPKMINLMDLLLADSTSFSLSYTDENNINVNDAIIYVLRKYIGTGNFEEVESGKTNNDGQTILHLVEEDAIYKFNVTKYGRHLFESSEYRAYCTAGSACTILLTSSGTPKKLPDLNTLPEGTYTLSANKTTRIVTLAFNLNETSLMNLTIYKFSQNQTENDIIIANNYSDASFGSVTLYIPVNYGNVTYYALIQKNNTFVSSQFINLKQDGFKIIGTTTSALLFSFMILCLALMSLSYGWGVIVFAILGVIIASYLQLIEIEYSLVIYFILAGLILIWKISQRGARE